MQLSELAYLSGGYFHQDWPYDHENAAEVIDAYLADPGVTPALLVEEIRSLVATATEAEVEAKLDDLGCNYYVSPGEGGYAAWLRWMADYVESKL